MATNRSSVRRAGRNRISRLLVTTSTLLGISTLAGLTTGAVDAPPPAGATTSASTLYVGNPTNHTITSYGIPTTGGNVKPGVTVSLAGNPSPAQLAFDASGDLWTANTDAGTISSICRRNSPPEGHSRLRSPSHAQSLSDWCSPAQETFGLPTGLVRPSVSTRQHS